MLTAKGETTDKVSGLKMGADDYITKPFEMKEVLARIEAVLRRTGGEEESSERRLVFDKLIIDLDAFELIVDGKRVDTPPKEMELLYHRASSPNRVYTRNQLLDEVWGFDYFGDSRTVDVHIKRLREKLEGVSDQWTLKTVWGCLLYTSYLALAFVGGLFVERFHGSGRWGALGLVLSLIHIFHAGHKVLAEVLGGDNGTFDDAERLNLPTGNGINI